MKKENYHGHTLCHSVFILPLFLSPQYYFLGSCGISSHTISSCLIKFVVVREIVVIRWGEGNERREKKESLRTHDDWAVFVFFCFQEENLDDLRCLPLPVPVPRIAGSAEIDRPNTANSRRCRRWSGWAANKLIFCVCVNSGYRNS